MALAILRALFLLAAAAIAFNIFRFVDREQIPASATFPWTVLLGAMFIAGGVIAVDVLSPRKKIDTISAIYFGLLVGVLLTYVLVLALTPVFETSIEGAEYRRAGQLFLGICLCYVCISLLLQTKDDFRFIIPYVEFSKEVKGIKPYVLDTSVVVDGRIADLTETNVFDNNLIVPRFVLLELQSIADSGDKLRRARGRRGLDVLNRLRTNSNIELKIFDREIPGIAGQPVDMKLVLLAKHLEGKIITQDYNLNKVARLHNVPVINLNDIANALKPVFLPGETLDVRVVKPGEEAGQGVGYLDDGTMIVVEGGRDHVARTVRVSVTSVLQTSAGRMIFGRYAGEIDSAA